MSDRQVGASGTWVTARVYVAAGIGGDPAPARHRALRQAVAINLDPGRRIKRADLSAKAPLILHVALIAAVETYRNGAKLMQPEI